MSSAAWKETDFEQWLKSHPLLSVHDEILIVGSQSPLRHVVDILGIDPKGRLVIMEVKNETSGRFVMAQALEYLAQYAGQTVQELIDEYGDVDSTALHDKLQKRGVTLTSNVLGYSSGRQGQPLRNQKADTRAAWITPSSSSISIDSGSN